MLFMSCVCHVSLLCIAALWSPKGERADLLALVCDVYCDFVTFPFGILIVSIPDFCCLSYFYISYMFQEIFHLFVTCLFLTVTVMWAGLQCLVVVSPDHTHLPFG